MIHQIISMIKWIRTSRFSIKDSLCVGGGGGWCMPQRAARPAPRSRCKATWKGEFQLPWSEAGPPNHVGSDQ
jgi:hypothetical protein